jgi:hypothetical protein
MILVDTSVWIDYFRGAPSPEAGRLAQSIRDEEDLCLCGLVLTEILQGIPSPEEYRRVRRCLSALLYLPTPRRAHILAADIYRAAARAGKVIRNSVDCIIAACAIVHDVPLLQKDKDFLVIAGVSRLRLVKASPQG